MALQTSASPTLNGLSKVTCKVTDNDAFQIVPTDGRGYGPSAMQARKLGMFFHQDQEGDTAMRNLAEYLQARHPDWNRLADNIKLACMQTLSYLESLDS